MPKTDKQGTPAAWLFVRLGWVVLLCLATSATGYAQEDAARMTMVGRVTDAETGGPLPSAHIFLANTLIGTTTDSDGRFVLRAPPGTHELVASMMGYSAQAQTIRVTSVSQVTFDFALSPTVYESPPVEIVGDYPHAWKRDLQTFIEHFIGTSANAARCTILNPEVLDFEHDREKALFMATASAPLVIENRALGYRLTWILNEFVLQEQDRTVRYRGQPHFEVLPPANDREQATWERRRQETYLGSLAHFLASLAQDQVEENGFRTRLTPYFPASTKSLQAMRSVKPHTLIEPAAMPFERRLQFMGYLEVTYRREHEEQAYVDFVGARRIPQSEQASYIELHWPALFHERGYLNDAYDATVYGYWGWERVADSLPRDYAASISAPNY